MPIYIIKIQSPKSGVDYFMEWSTISDSLYSVPMLIDDFKTYYLKKYQDQNEDILSDRLDRVDNFGISAKPEVGIDLEYLFENNKMRSGGTRLPIKHLMKRIFSQME